MAKRYDNGTASEVNAAARDIAPGTYVRRVNKAGEPQKQVRIMGKWCRYNRGYELTSENDINRCIYVNADTLLNVGFTH